MQQTARHPSPAASLDQLERYYQQVTRIILSRQHPITGLLPASTAVTAHGDYTDAWVRDNVYSILAAWGLGLAYRRLDESDGRTVLLEQSVVTSGLSDGRVVHRVALTPVPGPRARTAAHRSERRRNPHAPARDPRTAPAPS